MVGGGWLLPQAKELLQAVPEGTSIASLRIWDLKSDGSSSFACVDKSWPKRPFEPNRHWRKRTIRRAVAFLRNLNWQGEGQPLIEIELLELAK